MSNENQVKVFISDDRKQVTLTGNLCVQVTPHKDVDRIHLAKLLQRSLIAKLQEHDNLQVDVGAYLMSTTLCLNMIEESQEIDIELPEDWTCVPDEV